ncbi:MAG: hypothetical protein HY722_09650 [Planctomycetes bacterium]|nr:hypothetical protein [Planctomycetota bacterium]
MLGPLLVVATLHAATTGCNRNRFDIRPARAHAMVAALAARFDLGQTVWEVVRDRIDRSTTRRAEKLEVWDRNRDAFVRAIHTTVPADVTRGLLRTLDAVLPLVDDGTLPAITRDMAEVARRITSDPADPNREVLAALAEVLTGKASRRLYLPGEPTEVVGRALAYPQSGEVIRAVAQLVRFNDGEDDLGRPNGEQDLVAQVQGAASRALKGLTVPAVPGGGAAGGGAAASSYLRDLLEEATLTGPVQLGPPAWAVRVDPRGLPVVRADPATGTLYPPFVDRDGDLLADVDAQGRPVDAAGSPVDAAPFGTSGFRDADGRALAYDGRPLYAYFDAKRTHLGLLARFVGRLLAAGVHEDLVAVLVPALGPRVRHDAGTPADPLDDYDGYASRTPAADLIWGLAETARSDSMWRLTEGLADLADARPAELEAALVGVGEAARAASRVRAARPAAVPPGGLDALVDALLPIVDRVFETGRGGTSTARVVMDVLARLGPTAQDLPAELAVLFRYAAIAKIDPLGTGPANVDRARSREVDPSRPAFYVDASGRWVDNRSLEQQLLSVLARADGCPIFGKTLAELIIENMAGLSPATAGTLARLVAQTGPLAGLICPGIAQDIQSIDALAASGAMDAYLPIARVFRDRGQVRLLIDILKALEAHYDTALRPQERVLVEVLESGAVEPLLEVVARATTVTIPGSPDRVADRLAVAVEELVDDDRVVLGADGLTRLATPLHRLLVPLRDLDAAVAAAGATSRAERLGNALLEVALEVVLDDNGTPFDPSDDRDILANRSFVPMTARTLREAARWLGPDPVARGRHLDELEASARRFLAGRDLPVVVDLELALVQAPGKRELHAALANLLTPAMTRPQDVFGSVMEITAAVLASEAPVDTRSLVRLGRFAGDCLDPSRAYLRHALTGVVRLTAQDGGDTVVALVRNLFWKGPAGKDPAPVDVYARVLRELQAAATGGPVGSSLGPRELGELLDEAASFLRDPNTGLERIYAAIQARRR